MRIQIPRTTLLCVDCRRPDLALRALRLSLAQCVFESVRLLTDRIDLETAADSGIEFVSIPRIGTSAEYSRFMLKDLVRYVDTEFVQVIQWDGYVVNANAWSNDFLDYDYIGARWWFRPEGTNVGNGGFSLRSRRLLEALGDSSIVPSGPEDDAICLVYRAMLETRYGVRIAPAAVADRYAFEGTPPTSREFGFHRSYNFPLFHDSESLRELLNAISDEEFCVPASAALVRRLVEMGRNAEALHYARRIRAAKHYAQMRDESRAYVEGVVRNLVPRSAPCPCGSGGKFKQCCGTL